MKFSESEVGKTFRTELEKHEFRFVDHLNKYYYTRFKVYLNKHVPTHTSKFRRFWETKKFDLDDIPPSQPEIDMILIDNRNIWHAIELKAIKKTRQRTSPSYYLGLGQTLAYLSFGFDEVAIWQCFDANTLRDKEIFSYDDALTRIRNPIESMVGKTCFKIKTDTKRMQIQSEVFTQTDRTFQDGIGVFEPQSGKYRIRSVSWNPFLNDPKVKAIREFLEIQRTKLWDN